MLLTTATPMSRLLR
jgi:hypothetical protein